MASKAKCSKITFSNTLQVTSFLLYQILTFFLLLYFLKLTRHFVSKICIMLIPISDWLKTQMITQKSRSLSDFLNSCMINYNPANISTLDQHCRSTLKQRWPNVENEAKSDVGFSTLHNVDTTLIQRCFNLALMLVKAILNPVGLVMIVDLQIHE